jgi:hypothetical protein
VDLFVLEAQPYVEEFGEHFLTEQRTWLSQYDAGALGVRVDVEVMIPVLKISLVFTTETGVPTDSEGPKLTREGLRAL